MFYGRVAARVGNISEESGGAEGRGGRGMEARRRR